MKGRPLSPIVRTLVVFLVVAAALPVWHFASQYQQVFDDATTLEASSTGLLDDDLDSVLVDAGDAADALVTAASAEPAGGQTAATRAPENGVVIGSPDNPFSNTCDGKAIGFLNAAGERPRIDFTNAPVGAALECRTGRDADIARLPFRPCDGGNGSGRFHVPQFQAEGKHRTEVRVVGGPSGVVTRVGYYVHHSLDRVACCQSAQPDSAWFQAAAASALNSAPAFDSMTTLDTPFITIAARRESRAQAEKLLSLRRTFRLSPDGRLLLIRRTMASRRTLEKSRTTSCTGLTIAVPTYGVNQRDIPRCDRQEESEFHGGLVDANCPSIYCTVTSCRSTANGCIQVTHTFNRGRGQQPWVIRERQMCANQSLIRFTDVTCDAYVLNSAGDGVCLVNQGGTIRAVQTVKSPTAPLGLTILAEQRDPRAGGRYVFSAKTTTTQGVKNVLYLPR